MSTNDAATHAPAAYSDTDRQSLLEVARLAIDAAAHRRPGLEPALQDYAPVLRDKRACFVTLEQQGELRGCIGTLTARSPLVVEVAHMARAAAVEDPRFPPVGPAELPSLEIHISVLSVPSRMTFSSETDLIRQLRPGVDGLILRDAGHSGTFLPSVWEKLPEPREFLQHLKRKAGLPASHWSSTVTIERYETEGFGGRWWS